ncbi:hypothetical protein MGG_00944 [Pyricularia oryzae 70-15]|uniref:Uncharacterized protein n=3 Tax=Pyricularia oryzae TaxID=318829 RepID=G4NDD3_PYRO7|nr:uncharacterized protein MGG_00944 [Pyricularia oryzae 70-15]EHA48422.1 hypothetical protein MGG_00944 [Pyricularia oryzae 70-15]ELQ33982.1 hypothetical protein OOU_Y34scaffold00832g9 [Pyricularia oryzae Y34]KAI7917202.1 hypothetical protein M9X92_007524 [Pyricularia oryzae]KAI7917994.1 hypothetical protein M0657_007810 [Pyricularia oryzae]
MRRGSGSLSTFPQIQHAYSNPPPATSLAINDGAQQQQQQQNTQTHTRSRSNSITSRLLRPSTSSGDQQQQKVTLYPNPPPETPRLGGVLTKERRPSFGRKSSFSRLRRSSSASNVAAAAAKEPPGRQGKLRVTTDRSAPPLPDISRSRYSRLDSAQDSSFYLQSPPLSADSFSKMLSRTTTNNNGGQMVPPPAPTSGQTDSHSMVYQHIQETASKRISTLDYLRKAHEGRVYWFNTLLFDKPDLARMPYFDSRKLARRATNYLLLGLSLPAVVDLNSSTPLEFLRSLNILLGEFETFQTLHSESGTAASSLSRARIPNMFRRGAQSAKTRRTSGANDLGIAGLDQSESNGGPLTGNPLDGGSSAGGDAPALSFAASDTDLLPGEEYTHLLTPSLPFDPDFFETFATLCDVLIDCYRRLLTLLSSPKDCNAQIAELFTKADARVRKIIIQGAVKEFEDTSRAGVKNEVANVGKVVLGSLM